MRISRSAKHAVARCEFLEENGAVVFCSKIEAVELGPLRTTHNHHHHETNIPARKKEQSSSRTTALHKLHSPTSYKEIDL
jgi:hypothetical protein